MTLPRSSLNPPDWKWFALRVVPGREFIVEAKLRAEDHFTFVPLDHALTMRARRKVLVARAQYLGYCFIGQPPGFELPWLRIVDETDVLGVIGHDGAPLAIHEPSMIPMILDRLVLAARLAGRLRSRKRRGRNTAPIVSGPYQDRMVRVIEIAGEVEIFDLAQIRK